MTISFNFSYVPSVPFRNVLSMEFSLAIDEIFASKIWAMVCHLRNNGFEGFIYEVLSSGRLNNFLDRLSLGIDGRLYLKDLNITCESER